MSKRPSLAETMKAVADEPRPALYSVPAAAPSSKGRAKSREGKKLILTPLDPKMHLALRHRALDEGMTVEALVQAAIRDYLDKPAKLASTPSAL